MPTIDKTNYFARPRERHTQTERHELRRYFYHTRQWRLLRASYLADHPLCERCLETDTITPAEDVHHRETFTDKGEDWRAWALDFRNLMSVCKRCHGIIHAQQGITEDD